VDSISSWIFRLRSPPLFLCFPQNRPPPRRLGRRVRSQGHLYLLCKIPPPEGGFPDYMGLSARPLEGCGRMRLAFRELTILDDEARGHMPPPQDTRIAGVGAEAEVFVRWGIAHIDPVTRVSLGGLV